MEDTHEFLVTVLDALKMESQQKKPERRVTRGNSSNSDKENSSQVPVAGPSGTTADLTPEESPNEENESPKEKEASSKKRAVITPEPPSFVDEIFSYELVVTRVCTICDKVIAL